ncbi:hypothetical protein MNBD_BACTEROID03-1289 [hydrothermal vent metagenome]|uniref:Uncharacterized protein n=1 Tax=hydrothermal vent metagenome TaxID=652676 RepID=A0A3B0TBX1_9ZZZZ
MKNKYRFLQLLLLTLMFFGCETENVTTSEIEENTTAAIPTTAAYDFKVEVKNDMLLFATREDYDAAIEYLGPKSSDAFAEWETELGFKSMRNNFSEEYREKRGIYDDLLATLINPDAMIQIAGNVFKLDVLNETVTMVPASNYKDKTSLTGKNSTIFSTDDDILDIIDGTAKRTSLADRRYCKKRHLSTRYTVSDINIFGKAVYQRGGILKSLVANIKKSTSRGGSVNLSLQSASTRNFWKNKRHNRKREPNIPYYSHGGNGKDYSFRPYYASRRLKAYYFRMEFTAYDVGTGSSITRFVTIDCN